MDARAAKVVEMKGEIKLRGLTVSNLLIRAQRMGEEVAREIDFHKYNNITWDPERSRWGQKKWLELAECADDVNRLNELQTRVVTASRECDKVMRMDLSFDEVCDALERTALDLESSLV
jgi:hypothetical protein